MFKVKDGIIIKYGENEEKNGEIIGKEIKPVKKRKNIDNGTITVQLEFDDEGIPMIEDMKIGEINKKDIIKLVDLGAECYPEKAEEYVKYIRNEIKNVARTFEHESVGWGEFSGKKIFKHYKAVGIESEYIGDSYILKPKGSMTGWKTDVLVHILGHKWLEMMLCCSFAAAILEILSEFMHVDTLIFNFSGYSSKGKTIGTRAAMSIWGLPDSRRGGLIKTWHGTDAGILEQVEGNFGIPLVIDDTSHQDRKKDFTEFVYKLAGGISKAALQSNGDKRKQEEWLTVIQSSSEKPMFDQIDNSKTGAKVRLTECKVETVTASAEHAKKLEKGMMQNYGHAGMVFVEYLMKLEPKEVFDLWGKEKEKILERVEGDALSDRIAGKLSIVKIAGMLANRAMNLGIDEQMLEDTLIEIETDSSQDRNSAEKAYKDLMEYFATNPGKFFNKITECRKNGIVGRYEVKNGRITNILIPKNKFGELASQLNFDPEMIISEWKEKGYLNTEKDRLTIRKVFQHKMDKIAAYSIKVKDSLDKGNADDEGINEEVENNDILDYPYKNSAPAERKKRGKISLTRSEGGLHDDVLLED